MPCWKFKNSFIHRLFLCYYCTPEDERPKRKVRPGKGQGGSFRVTGQQPANTQSPEDGFMSIETQTNISVPSTGLVKLFLFQVTYTGRGVHTDQISDQTIFKHTPVLSALESYMVWDSLLAHFSLDNGLELVWSDADLGTN